MKCLHLASFYVRKHQIVFTFKEKTKHRKKYITGGNILNTLAGYNKNSEMNFMSSRIHTYPQKKNF